MFNFIKKLLGYPTDAEKAQAVAQVTETPLVHLGPEPVVEKPAAVPAPVVEPAPVKTAPAAITAKKKPAQKKPATVKPAVPAKPVARTRGRKPKPKV
jgi:hypothetical protein